MPKMQSDNEGKIMGVPKRDQLYARLSKWTPTAINRLAKLLDNPNPSVQLGAVKIVLERTVPVLKALEITGKDGQQIPIYIFGGGFLPPQPSALTPSNGDPFRLPPVQSPGVAQAVKKDNNGSLGVGKTEPA